MKRLLKLLFVVSLTTPLILKVVACGTNNSDAGNHVTENTDVITISKEIIANPQGNIEENRDSEQRKMTHSQFTKTEIFVTKNSKITLKLPENNKNLFSVFIGQWGIYKNLNNGNNLSPKEYIVSQQNQTIIPDLEGMLYLTNKSESNDYKVLVSVEKGIEVPTFVVDKTTNTEFQQMLNDNINSPFVEIIGKHVFGTFQMQVAKNLWINNDPSSYTINETFTRLDKIYELSNTVSGLGLNYDGVAHKFNNKVQISNPDTGGGYASATQYRIIFQLNSGAGEALFSWKKQWWLIFMTWNRTYLSKSKLPMKWINWSYSKY